MLRNYFKHNCIPIIIEILFVGSCFIVPRDYFIYTNCLFYLSLLFYFVWTKDFVLKNWLASFKSGKQYWKQVVLTLLAFFFAFGITMMLENLFPDLDTGTIGLKRNSWLTLFVFIISTVLLPAITEETFFRKNMILLENKHIMTVTTIFSMFLYALEHSLSWWGIVLTMIWALPLSIAYIKTKNIYVVMTAHFIGNLIGNGIDAVFTLFRLLYNG